MTARCEPPEHLRGVDGWHVISLDGDPEVAKWIAGEGGGAFDFYGMTDPETRWEISYVGPFTTPAEVEALRAEVMRAGAECADAMSQVATLRARVAELEAALRAADQFVTNGIELGFIRMPSPSTPDPAHRTPGIIRAALEGKNDG